MMNTENEIRQVLFEIGKDIKIHKLVDGNLILDIDYEKYVVELLAIFNKYKEGSND